ncbi:Protein yellow, partial [Gryllus bimaculatus]
MPDRAQRAAWSFVALAALLGCCAAQGAGAGAGAGLRELLAWKQVSFAFADDAARSRALDSGVFVPEHNAPLGLDVSGDRLFVTVPRWRKGVAATLNVVHLDDAMLRSDGPPAAPLLQPYPSWEANTLPADGEGEDAAAGKLVSVFRVRADPCGRLWALDTGLDDLLGSTRRVAPARLVGLVVYSWKQNASWRVEHHFFNFDPLRGNFHIGGANFQWKDGLFGVALSAPDDDGGRTAYFHPLASTHEFAVPTRVWQNSSAADDYYAYRVLGSRGERAQSTASFIHEPSGVLFYTLVNRNGVGCWNTNKPFSEENQGLAAHDDKALIFPNDLK